MLGRGSRRCWRHPLCHTWALVAGLVTATTAAQAQEPSSISYAAVAREASDKAPNVLAALVRARATRDSGPAPFGTPNPRLTVGSTEYGPREIVSFYAFLPFFGRRQAALATTEALADIADVDVEVARLDARLAVSLAWIDLWLADRSAELANFSCVRRDRLLGLAQERFDAGSAPRLDPLRARADALKQRGEADALQALRGAASARLAFLLGRDAQPSLATEGMPPTAERADAGVSDEHGRLEAHPVFAAARSSIKVENVAVRTQRRQLLPFVGVQAGANLNPRNGGPNDVNGALLMEFPVYGVPLLRRARAAERAAQESAALVMRRLELGVVEARAQLDAAARRAHAARDEVVPAAREMSELALEAYHEGSIDMTAALTSEQAYFDADLAAIQAEAAFARADAQLRHALGERP